MLCQIPGGPLGLCDVVETLSLNVGPDADRRTVLDDALRHARFAAARQAVHDHQRR